MNYINEWKKRLAYMEGKFYEDTSLNEASVLNVVSKELKRSDLRNELQDFYVNLFPYTVAVKDNTIAKQVILNDMKATLNMADEYIQDINENNKLEEAKIQDKGFQKAKADLFKSLDFMIDFFDRNVAPKDIQERMKHIKEYTKNELAIFEKSKFLK